MTLESIAPFRRPSTDAGSFPAQWQNGRMPPSWLRGSLVRTAPAIFHTPGAEGRSWKSEHWFDGLGAMFAFRIGGVGAGIGPDTAPRMDWRIVDCEMNQLAHAGRAELGMFGTPMRRSLLRRVTQPVPRFTDNVNVNVQPLGGGAASGGSGGLVAMTETPRQAKIDNETLAVTGWVQYDDKLGGQAMMTAHPHFDRARESVVNVAQLYGPKPQCLLVQHKRGVFQREVIGRWGAPELPYVHSFALTERRAVLVAHPLLVKPVGMLFSDKAYIDHFQWQPEQGTRLVIFDRERQQQARPRVVETEACFVFHVANAFDDDDGTIVVDVLAYPDAGIIAQLRTDNLAAGAAVTTPDYVRFRVPPSGPVVVERRMSPGFEFPSLNMNMKHAGRHRFCWGTDPWPPRGGSTVYKLDVDNGAVVKARFDEWTLGEPIFVAAPDASSEDNGALLAVGSHATRDASALFVLDGATLDVIATAECAVSVPLGFHGTFLAG